MTNKVPKALLNLTTATAGDNSTLPATTAFVQNSIVSTPSITATSTSGILSITLVAPTNIIGQYQGSRWSVAISTNLSVSTSTITSSLGAISGQQTRLAILYSLANNSLGLINSTGANLLDESNTLTPVVMSSGSTNASTLYSASGTTTSSYKIIGFLDDIWTSGVGWGTPSNVISASAAAYTGVSSIGKGQTWNNVLGSRAQGTTYYNNTANTIIAFISGGGSASGFSITGVINGISFPGMSLSATGLAGAGSAITLIIPPGASYSCTSGSSLTTWNELR